MEKKEMVRLAAVAAAAFALGASASLMVADGKPEPEAVEAGVVKKPERKLRNKGNDASAAALRARIKDLESRLQNASVTASVAKADQPKAESPRDRGDWLERIKKESPERYQQMTNRMARFRSEQLDRTVGRLDMLASVDVAGWSEKDRKVHEEYQELLAKREELMEMASPQNANAEERRAAFAEMRGLFGRLHQLGQAERDILMRKTAGDFGLTGADAKALVESVKAVYDVTSEFNFGGRRGRGGR